MAGGIFPMERFKRARRPLFDVQLDGQIKKGRAQALRAGRSEAIGANGRVGRCRAVDEVGRHQVIEGPHVALPDDFAVEARDDLLVFTKRIHGMGEIA